MNDSDNGSSVEEMIADKLNELAAGVASLQRMQEAISGQLRAPNEPRAVNLSPDSQNLLKSAVTTLQPLSETLPKLYEGMKQQNELLKNVPSVNELQKQLGSLLKENERLGTRETTALAGDAQKVKDGLASFSGTAKRAGDQFEGAVAKINRSAYAAWAVSVLCVVLACTVCVAKLYDKSAVKQEGADEQKNFVLENFYIFPKGEYRQNNTAKPWLLTPMKTDKSAKK